jgi:hypothetical protein
VLSVHDRLFPVVLQGKPLVLQSLLAATTWADHSRVTMQKARDFAQQQGTLMLAAARGSCVCIVHMHSCHSS